MSELAAPAPERDRKLVLPVVADSFAIAWRGLITYQRVPQLLVFSTIQPVVFVLMFRYVFGGAIRVPGVDYVDYLMPGIFIQTSVFGAIGTAIGLAADVQSGCSSASCRCRWRARRC
jgi:ABC-2 type transport system permease protein